MSSIQWLKPAPLWTTPAGANATDLAQPWLSEFDVDSFIPDFLALMDANPLGLAGTQPKLTDGKLKLYQPLHGRYYLVTGSLVCRQLGLPDREVARSDGERTSF